MHKVGKNIILQTSRDKLSGYITLIIQENEDDIDLNFNEYKDKIKEFFKFGLDENLLSRILTGKLAGEKLCIAKGLPPVHGQDGHIKHMFENERPLLPRINEDGTVDYKELDSLNNVKTGSVLAILTPPVEGRNGVDVNGKEISYKKGKTPRFRYGNNISLSSDGLQLISDIDGLVQLENGRVTVSKLLTLMNVDNSVGNINFEGNVIVNGDILNGFSLKAKGSVEIKGAIEGGFVESGGDILVRQGIQGYNRLAISTQGNLSAKFIENSILRVNNNIVAEAIMHSDVSSNSNILVLGRKGLIVGGIVRARNEIRGRIIGSTMATTTILEVGVDPSIKKTYDELEKKLRTNNKNLSKIEQSLNVMDVMKRSSKLDDEKLKLYNELIKAQLTLNIEISRTRQELEKTKLEMEDLSRCRIKVSDVIYPGVKIIIGNAQMHIRDEMKRCSFYAESGEIRIGSY